MRKSIHLIKNKILKFIVKLLLFKKTFLPIIKTMFLKQRNREYNNKIKTISFQLIIQF